MARNATKGLSPLGRAAAVIVALGADEAASVYKYLTEDEIEPPGLQMKMTCVLNNKTLTTDKWNHNTVRRILENPVYKGDYISNKGKKNECY